MKIEYHIPYYNPKGMYVDVVETGGFHSARLHDLEEILELHDKLDDIIVEYQKKIIEPTNTKKGLLMKFLMDSPEALDEERADKWSQRIIEILGIEDADDYLPVKEDKQ